MQLVIFLMIFAQLVGSSNLINNKSHFLQWPFIFFLNRFTNSNDLPLAHQLFSLFFAKSTRNRMGSWSFAKWTGSRRNSYSISRNVFGLIKLKIWKKNYLVFTGNITGNNDIHSNISQKFVYPVWMDDSRGQGLVNILLHIFPIFI